MVGVFCISSAGNTDLVATLLSKLLPSTTAPSFLGAVTWELVACRNPAAAKR